MLGWNKPKKPEPPQPAPQKPAPSPPHPAAPRQAVPATPQATRPVQTPARSAAQSLPGMLLEQGKATRAQLEKALAIQKETGAFLGEILVEEGILDETSLLSFLAKYCKIPHLSLLDYLIDAEVASLVPKEVCLEYRLIPIDKLGRNLTIAMVNPLNTRALEVVQEHCPGLRIKPILCAHKHFETVVAKVFGEERRTGGAVDLSASAFGIHLSPAEKAAIAGRKAPPPAERASAMPGAEDIPDAIAVDSDVDFAEKKMSHSTIHHVRFDGEQADADDTLDAQTVFDGVFRGDRAVAPGAETADESERILQDVTTVMMDSMRDTYEILARRMELFNRLDAENIAKIFTRGMTVEYQAGEVIFKKGQEGESLYVILNGNVAIADEGREIALLKQGDMFGEMALISQGKRSADAIAVNDVSLLALKMDIINNIMPRDVSVQLLVNIIMTLSRRLQEANTN